MPNVRFNAAKTLRLLVPILREHGLESSVHEAVKPCLASLTEDADHDVRYFASQGLQGC